jgi:hypothetical protein
MPVNPQISRTELHAVARAVQKHQLSPQELPSYLAGLAASPEMMELAAQLQSTPLRPDELAARLEEMAQ